MRAYEEDVESFPPDNPILLRWDADKWDRGERAGVGLTVLELSKITERHIHDLDAFALPHVDVPTHGLSGVTVGDVLRWARQHQPIPTLAAGS